MAATKRTSYRLQNSGRLSWQSTKVSAKAPQSRFSWLWAWGESAGYPGSRNLLQSKRSPSLGVRGRLSLANTVSTASGSSNGALRRMK
eukprot:1870666-Amphidinium_carterae.1